MQGGVTQGQLPLVAGNNQVGDTGEFDDAKRSANNFSRERLCAVTLLRTTLSFQTDIYLFTVLRNQENRPNLEFVIFAATRDDRHGFYGVTDSGAKFYSRADLTHQTPATNGVKVYPFSFRDPVTDTLHESMYMWVNDNGNRTYFVSGYQKSMTDHISPEITDGIAANDQITRNTIFSSLANTVRWIPESRGLKSQSKDKVVADLNAIYCACHEVDGMPNELDSLLKNPTMSDYEVNPTCMAKKIASVDWKN